MKALGIQLAGSEAILVVIQRDEDGSLRQTSESTRISLPNHTDSLQVRQFRNQVIATLDSIGADTIGILARVDNPNAKMKPSPVSFKLEGILQLYEGRDMEFVWPQTVSAYFKKNQKSIEPAHKYQSNAFDLALMLITKS